MAFHVFKKKQKGWVNWLFCYSLFLGHWLLEVRRVLELPLFVNWPRKVWTSLLLLLTTKPSSNSSPRFKRNSLHVNSVSLDVICRLPMVKFIWMPSRRLPLTLMFRFFATTLASLPLAALLISPSVATWLTITPTSHLALLCPTTSLTECSKRVKEVLLLSHLAAPVSSPTQWVLCIVSSPVNLLECYRSGPKRSLSYISPSFHQDLPHYFRRFLGCRDCWRQNWCFGCGMCWAIDNSKPLNMCDKPFFLSTAPFAHQLQLL